MKKPNNNLMLGLILWIKENEYGAVKSSENIEYFFHKDNIGGIINELKEYSIICFKGEISSNEKNKIFEVQFLTAPKHLFLVLEEILTENQIKYSISKRKFGRNYKRLCKINVFSEAINQIGLEENSSQNLAAIQRFISDNSKVLNDNHLVKILKILKEKKRNFNFIELNTFCKKVINQIYTTEILLEIAVNNYHLIVETNNNLIARRSHIDQILYELNENAELEYKSQYIFNTHFFIEQLDKINIDDLRKLTHHINHSEILRKLIPLILLRQEIHFNDLKEVIKAIFTFNDYAVESKILINNMMVVIRSFIDRNKFNNTLDHLIRSISNKLNDEDFKLANSILIKDLEGEKLITLWKISKDVIIPNEFLFESINNLSIKDYKEAGFSFHNFYFKKRIDEITNDSSALKFAQLILLIEESELNNYDNSLVDLNLTRNEKIAVLFTQKFIKNNTDINTKHWFSKNIDNNTLNNINLDIIFVVLNISKSYLEMSKERFEPKYYFDKSKNERIQFVTSFIINNNDNNSNLINENLLSLFCEKIVGNLRILGLTNIKHLFNQIFAQFNTKGKHKHYFIEQLLIEIKHNEYISKDNQQNLILLLIKCLNPIEKLKLWMGNYKHSKEYGNFLYHKIDENVVIKNLSNFDIDEQITLFKRLFYLIARKRELVNRSFFDSLVAIRNDKKICLEVRLCLETLYSLYYNNFELPNINSITDTIFNFINEDIDELPKIYFLFDKCTGRTWHKLTDEETENYNIKLLNKSYPTSYLKVEIGNEEYELDNEQKELEFEGEKFKYSWDITKTYIYQKIYDKPNNVTFCDAVGLHHNTEDSLTFFWCCNAKCYQPNQTDKIFLEWENYTLRDFIQIFGFNFKSDEYYRFLAILNRANRILKKLKCTNCGKILRDARTSNFAFYRVTTFKCINSDCEKHNEIVYLNHCLEKKCNNIVDSRISKRCPNAWYICNECNNCCSHKVIQYRYNNLVNNGWFNNDDPRHIYLKNCFENELGHFERGIKFDHSTGLQIQ